MSVHQELFEECANMLNCLAENPEMYGREIMAGLLLACARSMRAAAKGHARYEILLQMGPQQWAKVWELNVKSGKPFDEIIDKKIMERNFYAFGAATNNQIFDTKRGEWIVGALETQETLDQIEVFSEGWEERSETEHGDVGGFAFLAWTRSLAINGPKRQRVSAVDLGDARFILFGTDLTAFKSRHLAVEIVT